MAIAMIKPPMKRKIREFAYGAAASLMGAMPKTGNRTMGSSEVAGMGMASVIHHIAISKTTAVVLHASGSIPFGTGINNTKTNNNGPR